MAIEDEAAQQLLVLNMSVQLKSHADCLMTCI